MTSQLTFLYKFIYRAQYQDIGTEHELCWVYLGRSSDEIVANGNEVVAWRFISAAELDAELNRRPDLYTPWMKLEWKRIRADFRDLLRES